MSKDKDYLTIPEAAEVCSVSRTIMWRWVKDGSVKSSATLSGSGGGKWGHGSYPRPAPPTTSEW